MSVAQPIKRESTEGMAAASPDSERLVDQLANRIGSLGVELADVAGNLKEVAIGAPFASASACRQHGTTLHE